MAGSDVLTRAVLVSAEFLQFFRRLERREGVTAALAAVQEDGVHGPGWRGAPFRTVDGRCPAVGFLCDEEPQRRTAGVCRSRTTHQDRHVASGQDTMFLTFWVKTHP